MKTVPILVGICLAFSTRIASAQYDCAGLGHWTHSPVDVYVKSNSASVLSLTQGQVDRAITRAISIWNEEAGTRLRLQYRGTNTATDHINDAIYIKGINVSSGCSDALGLTGGQVTSGAFDYSTIDIYSHTTWTTGCGRINWLLGDEPADIELLDADLISVLVHELGHAAMGLKDNLSTGSCSNTYATVMGIYDGRSMRNLRLWDQAESQIDNGQRNVTSVLDWTTWQPGTSTWSSLSSSEDQMIWHRPNSLTQNYPYTVLGWGGLEDSDSGPYSRLHKEYYLATDGSFNDPEDLLTNMIQSTVGTAVSTSSGEVLMIYQRNLDTVYTTSANRICYTRSSDGGLNFGSGTCLSSSFVSFRYGATVGYDPHSDAFIIGISDSGNHRLSFYTVPATGSSTPSAQTTFNQNRSWHAPAIACKDATYGCRIVYEAGDGQGCLKWWEAGVFLTTGEVHVQAARTQCAYLYDTPSVVYHQDDDTFRLSFKQEVANYDQIFAWSMSGSGTSWSSMPDIWYSTDQASPPFLATERFCFGSCTASLRAWFVEYDP